MPIDSLSSSTSDAIFQELLANQSLAPATKAKLSKGDHGTKDVFDAANKVLASDGESLDSFDVDHDGQLSDDERDAAVSALVRLLSNPDTAQAFLDALSGQNQTDNARAASVDSAKAAQPSSSSGGASGGGVQATQNTPPSTQGGGAAAGASTPGATGSNPTGAAAQGGQTEASEFGTDKNVDPTKNYDSVPGGGYTVDDAAADIEKVAADDTKETGPKPTPEQAHELAQGIINGVNNYFDKSSDPKATAQTLIASAWKESKYNFNSPNGGVFQCAQNRFDDYQKAHPGSTMTFDQMSTTGNPAAAIDVSLWAMAHPTAGMGQPAGVATGVPADGSPEKALYFWNYNNRPLGGSTELDQYMDRTSYFRSLIS